MANEGLQQPIEPILSEAIQNGSIPEDASEMAILFLTCLREEIILQHYTESSNKVELPEARKILFTLAAERKKHQSFLQEFYLKLAPSFDCPEKFDSSLVDPANTLQGLTKHADLLDVFQQTMRVEKSSFDFYEKAFELCRNSTLQKLFRFFMEREKKHYDYLISQFAI
jgi:rubrerythrin